MEFVKVGNAGKFHSAIYHKLIRALVSWFPSLLFVLLPCKLNLIFVYVDCVSCLQLVSELGVFDVLLDLLAEKYLNYVDVGYVPLFFRHLLTMCSHNFSARYMLYITCN